MPNQSNQSASVNDVVAKLEEEESLLAHEVLSVKSENHSSKNQTPLEPIKNKRKIKILEKEKESPSEKLQTTQQNINNMFDKVKRSTTRELPETSQKMPRTDDQSKNAEGTCTGTRDITERLQ